MAGQKSPSIFTVNQTPEVSRKEALPSPIVKEKYSFPEKYISSPSVSRKPDPSIDANSLDSPRRRRNRRAKTIDIESPRLEPVSIDLNTGFLSMTPPVSKEESFHTPLAKTPETNRFE